MNSPATEQRILAYYESIGRVSRTMVTAARESDWEALAAAERIAGLLVERLEAFGDPASRLCPAGRRRRMAILRDVLDDDAAIRRCTEPTLARLDAWLAPLGAGIRDR